MVLLPPHPRPIFFSPTGAAAAAIRGRFAAPADASPRGGSRALPLRRVRGTVSPAWILGGWCRRGSPTRWCSPPPLRPPPQPPPPPTLSGLLRLSSRSPCARCRSQLPPPPASSGLLASSKWALSYTTVLQAHGTPSYAADHAPPASVPAPWLTLAHRPAAPGPGHRCSRLRTIRASVGNWAW